MRAAFTTLAILVASMSEARAPQPVTTRRDGTRIDAAVGSVRATEPMTIADQVRLCEVPAPPSGERARFLAGPRPFDCARLKR